VTVVIGIVRRSFLQSNQDRLNFPASMKNANKVTIVNFLARNGVIDAKQVRELLADLISTNLYMSD
jgi:hypothetical protein